MEVQCLHRSAHENLSVQFFVCCLNYFGVHFKSMFFQYLFMCCCFFLYLSFLQKETKKHIWPVNMWSVFRKFQLDKSRWPQYEYIWGSDCKTWQLRRYTSAAILVLSQKLVYIYKYIYPLYSSYEKWMQLLTCVSESTALLQDNMQQIWKVQRSLKLYRELLTPAFSRMPFKEVLPKVSNKTHQIKAFV